MTDPVKKTGQANPESYQPETPKMMSMLEEAQDNMTPKEKTTGEPAIRTFQIQHDSFLFLGIENKIEDTVEKADMGKVWGDFFKAGGYDKIIPYQKESCPDMVVYHNNDPQYPVVYFIGKIVQNVDKVPDGYTLTEFPAREFLVVTTEWMATYDEIMGENGLWLLVRNQATVQIPDGYIRYDGPGSQIELIEIMGAERETADHKKEYRYEIWVPIKKQNQANPESYQPETPKMMSMLEEAQDSVAQQPIPEPVVAELEIVKHGAYRFIGKSVYVNVFFSDDKTLKEIRGLLWKQYDWVFAELDKLSEYASDEPHNAALCTWEIYSDDEKQIHGVNVGATQLMGYTVGRFMKAGTPVPENMNYIDILEGHMAKGWLIGFKKVDDISGPMQLDGMVREAVSSHGYNEASWRFAAEIYTKPNEDGVLSYGYYCSCNPSTP